MRACVRACVRAFVRACVCIMYIFSGLSTGEMLFPAIYCPELLMEQAFTSQVADMKNSADDRNNALSSCAGA